MSNDKLLKEIGLQLETLAGKINVALAATHCRQRDCRKYNHGWPHNCSNSGPCIYHKPEERLGCLKTCHTEGCEYKDKLHPTCYSVAPCALLTKRPAQEPEEILQGHTLA